MDDLVNVPDTGKVWIDWPTEKAADYIWTKFIPDTSNPWIAYNPALLILQIATVGPPTPTAPELRAQPDWWPQNLRFHPWSVNCDLNPGLGCLDNTNCPWHSENSVWDTRDYEETLRPLLDYLQRTGRID